MKKWFVLGLTTLCSFPTFANASLDLDTYGSKNNPTSMRYYIEHYQDTDNLKYQSLMISVRAAAYAIDLYTTRLDARNQRIDYCLPMLSENNRQSLDRWKTKDLIKLINSRIERDASFKKYGKNGMGVDIGSYLVAALKEQYPCPVQKQL
ncbi:hypothetical protein [Vibrio parahaemolyticus]|uniref:hypothetical protein n=1 Tax=Vibrio parahaemolyticus TaxID=670 RepID=UPI00221FEB19|nr:hypothetical protein [Vibrio parahaemolyticus]MCZ6417392.1 hypothetical protein [Vibrio parahaemolyticus]MCZ6422359.1 hypothetical protein [Vibrio parahaemolyticus]MEA5339190.1 hypothetical protein [Vibrio parahaemolyticus]WPD17869.1 hypothetical protein PY372_25225 [Vibrio parahaemolyticus]